jgi:AcrR family transcriptional regulator
VDATKKEGILCEAAKAFARFGFKKTSIDEIAKKAGVAKGSIYLACESKHDLFYQVLHREVRAWIAAAAQTIDPRVPADELLVRTSDAAIAYLMDRPLMRLLLFGEAHALMPEWVKELDALTELARGNVEEILELGVRQRLFREAIDVPSVAQILLDLQLAYFVLHDRGEGRLDELFERRKKAAFDLVLNGLRAG